MKKILIVEDEKNLGRFIELELQHEGYEPTVVEDGIEGLRLALDQKWDAILLDIMVPGKNGLEICRRIRQEEQKHPEKLPTPIIISTARDSVIDRVSGLDHGADDYIVKPYAIEELLARLRALFRRVEITNSPMKQTVLKYRDLVVEKESHIVRRGDEVIDLTKREYELLVTFMENLNIVLSREALLTRVWGYITEVETNVVDVYIRYLRNKIDRPGDEESYIQTVRGTGYVMRT